MNLQDMMTPVAILDNDSLEPLFESVSPMRVSTIREKKATKFAVEDGTERSDHIVKALTEISIDILAADDVRNAYENLVQVWAANKLVTVQTKAASFPNMLLTAVPHDETIELGTSINMSIRLQEWVEVKPETGELPPSKVANKNKSSTVKRGQSKGTETTKKKGSILSGWFK